MNEMKASAEEMGANAVIGVDLDFETITLSRGGTMMMVSAAGTAVNYKSA